MILLSWVTFTLSNFHLLFHFSLLYICFLGLSFVGLVFVRLCFTCVRNVWHWFWFACVCRLLLGASCYVNMLLMLWKSYKYSILRPTLGITWFFFLVNEYSLPSEKNLGVFFPYSVPCREYCRYFTVKYPWWLFAVSISNTNVWLFLHFFP